MCTVTKQSDGRVLWAATENVPQDMKERVLVKLPRCVTAKVLARMHRSVVVQDWSRMGGCSRIGVVQKPHVAVDPMANDSCAPSIWWQARGPDSRSDPVGGSEHKQHGGRRQRAQAAGQGTQGTHGPQHLGRDLGQPQANMALHPLACVVVCA